ncbi:MAG: quinone-dependent dihydroorotate dehydrogenase, partial [Bdellovibrionales bacterium]|nr:quinone-dependent dihydroorotate dehydrogenase [Bdellovibrionales bacterium]
MQPWLWLPARLTHKLAPLALSLYGQRHPFQTLTWKSMTWRGLHFPNRLGLAAGVDKNAENISDWWTLGPGFLEIGTVTPLPQGPNPGKVVDRDASRLALWNRLGFPSVGAKKIKKRVERLKWPHFTPVFVNVGRNRTTPNEKAADDYVSVMLEFKDCADAFVINISSPNTQGLRDLQQPETLRAFLKSILNKVREQIPKEKMPILDL